MALILTGADRLAAQQSDINTLLQYFDAEESIPDEDLTLISEILDLRWPVGIELAEKIIELSIIDYDDEKLLKTVHDAQTFLDLANNEKASLFLRELISSADNRQLTVADIGSLTMNQYVVFSEDNRYRWKINYNHDAYRFGMIVERDPNESEITDHFSYSLSKQSNNNELIIGDYQIVSGYGLWSWRSVATRKGFESVTALSRMGSGASPYRSANEYWYIRGINYSLRTKHGRISCAGGYTKQDGSFDDGGKVNISTAGLHTGETSIDQKNNITESLVIGQWHSSVKNSTIVASAAGTNWTADNNTNTDWSGSVAVNHAINDNNIFGEFGRGYNNTAGMIAGLRLRYPAIIYLLSARYYSKGYTALRANPFAEWVGEDRNERGVYQGLKYKFGRHNLLVYGDIFKTNELENKQPFPIIGQETGIRWEWRKGRSYQRLQWKQEKKTIEDGGAYLADERFSDKNINTYKYNGVFQLKNNLWSKLQLTYSNEISSNSKSEAFGLDTNIWWELKNLSILFDILAVFSNDGAVWIYFWDVNLPGEMTTRVYTKDTLSSAIKIIYRTNKGFEIGARFRTQWPEFKFSGTPDLNGALIFELLL